MIEEVMAGLIAAGTIIAFFIKMYSTNKKVKQTEKNLLKEYTEIAKQQVRLERCVSYLKEVN